jgi:hypothetical protein
VTIRGAARTSTERSVARGAGASGAAILVSRLTGLLRDQVMARDVDDVRPLHAPDAPEEIAPLINSFNDLLARIDWRSDIHRFSAWTTLPTGTKYPARVVGYKKATGKTWYYDDVTEVTPLKELPEKLQPTQPAAK